MCSRETDRKQVCVRVRACVGKGVICIVVTSNPWLRMRVGFSLCLSLSQFDSNGDGQISIMEHREAMKKLMGEQLTNREIDEILRDVDLNGDGLVDFEGKRHRQTDRQTDKIEHVCLYVCLCSFSGGHDGVTDSASFN